MTFPVRALASIKERTLPNTCLLLAASTRGGVTITGFNADNNSVYHGFIRTARGKITTFDVPGAGTGNWQGTLPLNITPDGAVTGWYIDANGVYHGFLRFGDDGERQKNSRPSR